jgi:N-acetylneuraminic acid mutarotase
MAKKDKKAKSAEAKALKALKQSKKAAKTSSKLSSKTKEIDSDAEDIDLDAVLAAYAAEQTKFLTVTEESSPPPTPRASSTIAASPSNKHEIFLFGGEYLNPDTSAVSFFNDLYIYHIHRHEWRKVTSPNSPLPRSGHAWTRASNTGGLYLFGGEFSSPKQGTFYHYNDFWHLDTSTREWTRLEPRKGAKNASPPARSGHRMTCFKQYVLLFGGFQDTSQTTKYLADLWVYDIKENVWHEVKFPAATQRPDPRSSFSFLPHESGAVMYGGYSRQKAVSSGAQGKGGKGGGPSRNLLKPVVHQDTWFIRITPPAVEASDSPPGVRWERRKRPANAPNPARAGATMAFHKSRGVLFGGVHDVEESEEGIESEFFDQLFVWNIDRNRFFPLSLRRPKAAGKKAVVANRRQRGKADEEELLANLARLEAKGGIAGEMDGVETMPADEEQLEEKKELPVKYEFPHRRFNAQLAVQDDTLFIFGGTFERGDLEFTFADMYTIDLGKLDGVREVFYEEPKDWNKQVEESDDSDDDEDMEDSEEDGEEDDAMSLDSTPTTAQSEISASTLATEFEAEETETITPLQQDSRPYPRPFESLRDFFARTGEDWQRVILAKMPNATSESSIKDLRKKGFSQAEERWWDCREEVRTLEDEQEAAGISEVVSLADRGQDAGAGRRR